MVNIGEIDKCSGCGSCFSKCPANAISIQKNKEGFLVPMIDEKRCIHCSACSRVCPILNCTNSELNFSEGFYGHHKDENIRLQSTSGGIFYAIASQVLEDGGVVFGAAFDDNLNVYHTYVETKEELARLQGSKYSESNCIGIYPVVEEILMQGRKVLFSGVPCQIEALLNYLGKEYEELITIDFICYGIQSPLVFSEYLASRGIQPNEIDTLKMRSKKYGWLNYSMKIIKKNGEISEISRKDDPYLQSYSKGLFIRESCYSCKCKRFPRRSDLTLGDFWDVKTLVPNIDYNKGESLIICNTQQGRAMIEHCKDIFIDAIPMMELHLIHKNYAASATRNPKREYFFEQLGKIPFEQLVKICTKKPWKQRIKDNIIQGMKDIGIYKYYKKIVK